MTNTTERKQKQDCKRWKKLENQYDVRVYRNCSSIMQVSVGKDDNYEIGVAYFGGGVVPYLMHRSEFAKFRKQMKYRRVWI